MSMLGFWAGKRVVVTGGAGFLGSFVVDALRGRGIEPVVPRSSARAPRPPSRISSA